MKIDIDLPWGGKLHYEREPMSEDARFNLHMGVIFVIFVLIMAATIWILR